MITVTLTNPRHIAAAAQLAAAAQFETAAEYVQDRLNRAADSWVETTKVDQIRVFEFVERFTAAEFAAITAAGANDANVAAILATLRARDSVRLGSPDALNGVGYLVSIGLLTQQRADIVLAY